MECRACAGENDPGRRYCRVCGGRLGQPCGVCEFFNAFDDRHCGGCGRRLPALPAGAAAGVRAAIACAPPLLDDRAFAAGGPSGPAMAGVGVSASEIDGLFESILDEDPVEGG